MKLGNRFYIALCLLSILPLELQKPVLGEDTAELAVVPYHPLWMIIESESLPEGFKCSASFRITAGGKNLPPPDLKVHIEAGEARVPLPVSKTGAFELPENRKWAEANARIVSNQPKGSLRMICGLEISGSSKFGGGNLKYRDTMFLLKMCYDRLKGVCLLTGTKFEESSLHLEYTISDPRSENREITIYSDKENLIFEADSDGVITIPFNSRLFDENPKIDIPTGTANFDFKFGGE